MATMELEYDVCSRQATQMIKNVQPFGWATRRKSGLEEAMEDIKAGRVYTAQNGEDLIRQCLA